jgi:hypothetical protein
VGPALAGGSAQHRKRQDHLRIRQPPRLGRHGRGEGIEQRILVLDGRVGFGPPEAQRLGALQREQPVRPGVWAGVAQLGRLERRDSPADRALRRADEDDPGVADPPGSQAVGELGSRGALAIDAKRRHADEPGPNPLDVERCERRRSGQLDDIDPRPVRADGLAPTCRPVDEQTDATEQLGARRLGVHRSVVLDPTDRKGTRGSPFRSRHLPFVG